MVMSASDGRTYLANFMACKGSFKSDKQLINEGLILSLGFFADSEEVLCIEKSVQQRFSMLLGKEIHYAYGTLLYALRKTYQ